MENYGYAIMTETPCVIANVQRTGPSTGQPTLGAQGDMMQVRYGSHGDMVAIAYAPSTVQECLDMTIQSFNLSEKYRHPVCLMTDGEVGHLREKVVVPDENEMELFERVQATTDKETFIPFAESPTTGSKVPDFPTFGTGYHTYVTGLTHNDHGFPRTDKQADHERLVMRIITKITDDRTELTDVEEIELEDAEVAFVTYGASARPAESAVAMAREKGIKAGMLRMKLCWPFPRDVVNRVSKQVDKIIVPEMNLGQMYHSIKEYSDPSCEVELAPKIGGEMHLPHELLELLEVS